MPAALALLALSSIGAAVAITQRLPYGFAGHGHPDNVWGDFLHGGGTALSPPLPTLLILALCTMLATRPRWPGIIGRVALTIAGAAFVIAILGEPLTRKVLSPEQFEPLKATLTALGILAATMTAAIAIRSLPPAISAARAHPTS